MAETNWYTELKFAENPLDSRPNAKLIGLEEQEERLKNHINKEEVCFLHGLTGSGKSSLLKKLQQEMKDYKFIYLDAQDLPQDFDIEQELRDRRGFFDRLRLKNYPTKKPVLIIDEFQATDKDLVLKARGKWENPNERQIKSIIIAQIEKHLKNVTPSFKERIGHRTIQTRVLDDDEMKEIIRKRLHNERTGKNLANNISEEALDLLVHVADGNPRRLLEYTDLMFDFHFTKFNKKNPVVEKDDYVISYYAAKEILELNKIDTASFEGKKRATTKRRKSSTQAFEKMFNKEQQQTLKFLMTGPKTMDQMTRYFKISESKARQTMSELIKKKAIVSAGKKDNKKLYRCAPHIKRLTVKV
ncbi:AAA family ATPase [Candidatus Woesearchaeota archaeon]|nr:AAA family ATPase [Candidatus Woesearchaeota archaeon]